MKKMVWILVVLAGVHMASAETGQAFRQLIPAVASTPGVAGSYWRTDLFIHNPSDRAVELTLEFLPSRLGGGMGDAERVTLPSGLEPMETVVIEDVVGEHFPAYRTGALIVVALGQAQEPVPVVAATRTWTPAPDGGGSFGQGIAGVVWADDGDLESNDRVIPGLESSEHFRTNLGVVNPTGTIEELFAVEVLDESGVSVGTLNFTLGPKSHYQSNDILSALNVDGAGYSAVVRLVGWNDLVPGGIPDSPPSAPPDFAAYASKVDQHTNDPSYLEAQSEVTRWGPPRYRAVPAVASTPGAGGTHWTTDLSIHYPGDQSFTFLQMELIPTGGDGIGSSQPERVIGSIRQSETASYDDVLGESFPDHDVAALMVETFGGNAGIQDLRVVSRTWTPSGEGTMGQGIPGIPNIPTSDPVVITGLESSSDFRTNLGLVNPSLNLRETFDLEFYDGGGAWRGTLTHTLEPWSHEQLNGVLDLVGLQGAGYTAVVRLVEVENLYYHFSESWEPIYLSYGSRVDRQTGDPTYLEAAPLRVQPERGDWFDFEADSPWYRCPSEPFPEESTVLRAFDQAYHWWGDENHRSIIQEVDFPEDGDWNQVGLRLELECPENGLCDHWDRTGSLQLVLNPDDPEEDWQYLELMRHITPYRVEMCQYVDITPLAPLLRGRQTLVSWIDTWVGPGHAEGEGWRVSFDFVFYPGESRAADEVLNIWGRRNITLGYTDPDNSVEAQIEAVDLEIPAEATRVEARLITTGHSFGNTDNCAEFCVLRQDLWVNGELRSVLPWRTDCEYNTTLGQQGTYQYDRNGWCPGAIVVGQTLDITDLVSAGSVNTIDFDIRTQEGEVYVNTDPGGYDPLEWISLQLYVFNE